jgi:phosphoribosylformylglycinamidine synthase
MKAAVITFPGSNCDRDLACAFETSGAEVVRVWHKATEIPAGTDVVGIPGGFSFGDYLRCGAIASRSPIGQAIAEFAGRGGHVIGVCNGFQVLTEMGLLPGALMRNAGLKFISRPVALRVESTDSVFTSGYAAGQEISIPIAHAEGNYQIDAEGLARLQGEGLIALRYVQNPNGATDDIAGVLSANRRVLGLMPHPERVVEPAQGGTDGAAIFRALAGMLAEV